MRDEGSGNIQSSLPDLMEDIAGIEKDDESAAANGESEDTMRNARSNFPTIKRKKKKIRFVLHLIYKNLKRLYS